jgi:hypothetical protein
MCGADFEIKDFIKVFKSLPHKIKILIAGNHEKGLDHISFPDWYSNLLESFNIDKNLNPYDAKQKLFEDCGY